MNALLEYFTTNDCSIREFCYVCSIAVSTDLFQGIELHSLKYHLIGIAILVLMCWHI